MFTLLDQIFQSISQPQPHSQRRLQRATSYRWVRDIGQSFMAALSLANDQRANRQKHQAY